MSADGRIVTFYSYKGGTGRSMALANIAWMLAAAGHRVLAIDWDLEAPGLHRYFHPFLQDSEMASTPGVIDFVTEFAMAATQPREGLDEDWYHPYADLTRYAVSLDTPLFPTGATLDLVPAGRQGASYAVRVNSFDWQSFWDRLGGAALLQAMREGLRADYDYVLIDSRTGVGDTSGICTVALPDRLVVAFTLNRQSIRGAVAATQSVVASRDRSQFRVYPVPMRVEFAEKDRLELARKEAQHEFNPFLWHVGVRDRQSYWGAVEVVYHPYYAYEEVLAVFADRPEQRTSLLAALEQVTSRLTDGSVSAVIPPRETERRKILALYQRQPERTAPQVVVDTLPRDEYVFLSAPSQAAEFATRLTRELESGAPPIRVWTPNRDLTPGEAWAQRIDAVIRDADCVLITVTADESSWQSAEWQTAVEYGKPVVPLVLEPGALRAVMDVAGGRSIDFAGDFDVAVQTLRHYLAWLRSPEGRRATLILQLDEARRAVERASSDSDKLKHKVRIDDLEARLAKVGGYSDEAAPTADELTLRLGPDDGIDARWRGAEVTSTVTADDLQARLLLMLSEWRQEGRFRQRRELQLFGELLYARLFPGSVASLLSQALETASPERPLRLVLQFDAGGHLGAELPWEFLYKPADEFSPGAFLVTRGDLVLSRTVALAETLPAPEVASAPARLLVAMYGPEERSPGTVAALRELEGRSRIELEELHDPPLSVMLERIEELRPAIVHLVAGARSGSEETEVEMAVLDGVGWIGSSRLIDLVGGLEVQPPLFVLELAREDSTALHGGDLARGLARLGVAAVLQVDSPLDRGTAETFFISMYEGLLAGEAIDIAIMRARRHLTRRNDSASFGVPTLYMNHPGPVAAPARDPVQVTAPVEDRLVTASQADPAVSRRLRRALESAQPWRTLERLAIEAAVPETVAASVLRVDDDVRFSVGRNGRTIVGLVSRVGA